MTTMAYWTSGQPIHGMKFSSPWMLVLDAEVHERREGAPPRSSTPSAAVTTASSRNGSAM